MRQSLPTILLLLFVISASGQQTADDSFVPVLDEPAYEEATGPLIMIDEGHFNFHTLDGRYKAFATLMRVDGYRLEAHKGKFTDKSLAPADILVIANALHRKNERKWHKPVLSAFDDKEIETLKKWVMEGGSLLLIADHMPMGGAAKKLAATFGVTFYDGFALDTTRRGPDRFTRHRGHLLDHKITNGREKSEAIDSVVSFTGQAFQLPEQAEPLMIFPEGYLMLFPDTAWQFHQKTPSVDVSGWPQGAVMEYGRGRLALFGEAAMFTAQQVGEQKIRIGINSAYAPQNHQFLLNVIHWLDQGIEW